MVNSDLEEVMIDGNEYSSLVNLQEELKKKMLESKPDDSSEADIECAMDCCNCKNNC